MIATACSGGITSASSGVADHADAGEAALGEAKQGHGDRGDDPEQRFGGEMQGEGNSICGGSNPTGPRPLLLKSNGSPARRLQRAGKPTIAKNDPHPEPERERGDARRARPIIRDGLRQLLRMRARGRNDDGCQEPTSRYHEVYAQWQRDPEGFWAEAAKEIDWIEPAKKVFDPSMGVYGRWFAGGGGQHLLQRARPPCGARARRAGGADLRFAGHRHAGVLLLRRDAVRGDDARRDPAGFRRRQGRPRHPLHAAGAGSGVRDAGLRAHRRGSFGGVRRLCRDRACQAHRRRQAEADPLGKLRHRARPHRQIQAAAR